MRWIFLCFSQFFFLQLKGEMKQEDYNALIQNREKLATVLATRLTDRKVTTVQLLYQENQTASLFEHMEAFAKAKVSK